MDNIIRFSILVPVYNVENYLRQCVDSLINQNSSSYEIVLIDDGSTDSSGHICDEYLERNPELIRVIHKDNEGLLMARRTAVKEARGQYFIFIDSDDFVEKDMLNKFHQIVDGFNPDMIIYHMDRFDGENYYAFIRNTLYNESRLITSNEKEDYYRATLTHSISNGMCGKVVSRKIVDIENDYEEFRHVSVAEDLLQSLPLITNSNRIYFLNDILYHYRINMQSVGRVFNYNRYDSMRSVEIELKKYSEKWDVKNKFNLLAKHALTETVWGSLRTLSKYDISLTKEESIDLIKKMAKDGFMKEYYLNINKSYLNPMQRIVLFALYNEKHRLLIVTLKLLAKIKK